MEQQIEQLVKKQIEGRLDAIIERVREQITAAVSTAVTQTLRGEFNVAESVESPRRKSSQPKSPVEEGASRQVTTITTTTTTTSTSVSPVDCRLCFRCLRQWHKALRLGNDIPRCVFGTRKNMVKCESCSRKRAECIEVSYFAIAQRDNFTNVL
jgi:hypothetical protein